mmetsp:Transcript_2905/g.5463  ORF Transcript_2905/g.5463 Transcript_2905/m.5463 type:complete len:221 (+) Transcript_2905:1823-2485(+)
MRELGLGTAGAASSAPLSSGMRVYSAHAVMGRSRKMWCNGSVRAIASRASWMASRMPCPAGSGVRRRARPGPSSDSVMPCSRQRRWRAGMSSEKEYGDMPATTWTMIGSRPAARSSRTRSSRPTIWCVCSCRGQWRNVTSLRATDSATSGGFVAGMYTTHLTCSRPRPVQYMAFILAILMECKNACNRKSKMHARGPGVGRRLPRASSTQSWILVSTAWF